MPCFPATNFFQFLMVVAIPGSLGNVMIAWGGNSTGTSSGDQNTGSRYDPLTESWAATTTALGFVSHEEAGLASGVVNTFHEVGGSIGIAIVSTLAASGIEQGAVSGFDTAYLAVAVLAVLAVIVALPLIPRREARMPEGVAVH